ncbi:MAG TPA: hypothetical protein VJN39_07215, partial [Gemmatimonadales bacterium]|nr:hypothetical protein [Gemmatimonadales bacterium]
VVAVARYDKKKALIRERAAQAAAALRDATDLIVAGRARGYHVEKVGPFTRVHPAAEFAGNLVLLGAAFGLRPGERSGVVVGETGCFLVQSLARQPADSAAWLKQRAQQREDLMRRALRDRAQQYLAALRAQAKVVDRREELFRPTAAAGS